MTASNEGPMALRSGTVLPEWIDYNRHMNAGFYAVAFDRLVDDFMDVIGLDAAYRARTGGTIYTAEAHIVYLRELKEGAPLRFEGQLLAHDARRIHLFLTMHHASEGYLAATAEKMLLHVSQQTGRVAPMPAETLDALERLAEAQRGLPVPKQAGRRVGFSQAKE